MAILRWLKAYFQAEMNNHGRLFWYECVHNTQHIHVLYNLQDYQAKVKLVNQQLVSQFRVACPLFHRCYWQLQWLMQIKGQWWHLQWSLLKKNILGERVTHMTTKEERDKPKVPSQMGQGCGEQIEYV